MLHDSHDINLSECQVITNACFEWCRMLCSPTFFLLSFLAQSRKTKAPSIAGPEHPRTGLWLASLPSGCTKAPPEGCGYPVAAPLRRATCGGRPRAYALRPPPADSAGAPREARSRQWPAVHRSRHSLTGQVAACARRVPVRRVSRARCGGAAATSRCDGACSQG